MGENLEEGIAPEGGRDGMGNIYIHGLQHLNSPLLVWPGLVFSVFFLFDIFVLFDLSFHINFFHLFIFSFVFF